MVAIRRNRVVALAAVVVLLAMTGAGATGCSFWWEVPYPPYLQHLTGEADLSGLISSRASRVELVAVPAPIPPEGSPAVPADHLVLRARTSQNVVLHGMWISRNLEVLASLGGADLEVGGVSVSLDGPVFRTTETQGGGIQMGEVLLQENPEGVTLRAQGIDPFTGPLLPRTGAAEGYLTFFPDQFQVAFEERDALLQHVPGGGWAFQPWFPDATPEGQEPPAEVRTRYGVGADEDGEMVFWVLLQFDYWFEPPEPLEPMDPLEPPELLELQAPPRHVVFRTFSLTEVEALLAAPPDPLTSSVFTWVELEGLAGVDLGHHVLREQDSIDGDHPIHYTNGTLILRVHREDDSRGDYRKNDHFIAIDLESGNKLATLWLHQDRERAREITGVPDPAGAHMWLYDATERTLLRLRRWW